MSAAAAEAPFPIPSEAFGGHEEALTPTSRPAVVLSAAPSPPVSPAVLELLDRAGASLLHARQAGEIGDRYVTAHLAGLRAAAALLAARTGPARPSRPRSVWEMLPTVAPELTEWATFFAGSARRRSAIERGQAVPAREADDLLRQAEVFVELVETTLGVPHRLVLPTWLVPAALGPAPARPTRRVSVVEPVA